VNRPENDSGEKPVLPSELNAPLSAKINGSRRRFTASGLAASGVMLTLASRSVMGQTVAKSPSGFVSGNQSSHGPQPVSLGRSPGYWKNHASDWPVPPSTMFKNIFSCSTTSVYAKYTMMQLESPQADDRNNLGMHLVAAWLNARKGWTPFLSEERICSMFTEWQNTGYFAPTAGVQWSGADIVNYLKSTMS
jgi:hypothetical protein